ncbi:MAG: hypothetical protein HQL61_10520 [Magnetococcales bacterium]|nr:hypothetical protein [Nitrospirota bacterium]
MLYTITQTDITDELFKEYIGCIKRAYYDEESYLTNREYRTMLPTWSIPIEPGKCLDEIESHMKRIVDKRLLDSKGLYTLSHSTGTMSMNFPFVNRLQHYFMKRKWQQPERDPQQKFNSLLRLNRKTKDNRDEEDYENYSKNIEDFNHFVNVVAAMARLISYFREESVKERHKRDDKTKYPIGEELEKSIAYRNKDGFRIFTLMLAAFYHDIGKTVVYHRHGMEGAIILSDHRSESWYELHKIVSEYKRYYRGHFCYDFEHDDLIFIADMLHYHDLFGSLSTGESGYMRMVDLIVRIKRHSYVNNKIEDQMKWGKRFLFDLALLNIADMMVSRVSKGDLQEEWYIRAKANQEIETFLKSKDRGHLLIHDLCLAFKLFDSNNQNIHSDNQVKLSETAFDCSNRHLTERLRRLIVVSVSRAIRVFEKPDRIEKKKKELSDREKQRGTESGDKIDAKLSNASEKMAAILKHLKEDIEIREEQGGGSIVTVREDNCTGIAIDTFMRELNTIINQHIKTIAEIKEFGRRLSYVGQMDYALACFEKIALTALDCVFEELYDPYYRTNLIKESIPVPGDATKFFYRLHGKLIVENLSAIFIEIIHHLLFRDDVGDRIRNIEFNELRDRLTEDRVRSILSLDGPARTKRALQLILQTVFLY